MMRRTMIGAATAVLVVVLAGCAPTPTATVPAAAAPVTVTVPTTTTMRVTATQTQTKTSTVTETATAENVAKNRSCIDAIQAADDVIKEHQRIEADLADIMSDYLDAARYQDSALMSATTARLNKITVRAKANNDKYTGEFQPAAVACVTG